MRRRVQQELDELELNDIGRVVIGNWFPNKKGEEENGDDHQEDLSVLVTQPNNNNRNGDGGGVDGTTTDTEPQLFDTILVDYLIGAMDAFSPYKQDVMIDKLAALLQPGTGRM